MCRHKFPCTLRAMCSASSQFFPSSVIIFAFTFVDYSHIFLSQQSLSSSMIRAIIHGADHFSLLQPQSGFVSTTNISACTAPWGPGRFRDTSQAPSAWTDRAYRLSPGPGRRPVWASIRSRRPRRARSPLSSSCTCDSGTRFSPG